MSDIRCVRTRPGVRIYLHPADLTDVITQDDVVQCLNEEELEKIIFVLSAELQGRNENEQH